MKGPGFIFQDDPLLELQRNVQQNARKMLIRVKQWHKDNPTGIPPKEVIDTQKEARETTIAIEKMRIGRERLALETRISLAKLPPVDEAAVQVEVHRMLEGYLNSIDGKTLYALASKRLQEEREIEQESEIAGRGALGSLTSGNGA